MGDAVGLFDYWQRNPPVHVILRLVHMKDAGPASPRDLPADSYRSGPAPDEGETRHGIGELMGLAGPELGTPRKMPEHLAAMADYAEEVLAKMRKQHA